MKTFLADLHVHSTFSDGRLTIPELVDLYGSRGFGALAITDHLCEDESWIGKAARFLGRTLTEATFPLYQEILEAERRRAWRRYGLVLIPGAEFTRNTASNATSAHILGIGTREWISANGAIESLCREIRNQGGITVAAHPVSTRRMEKQTYHLWDRRAELATHFDAWEVASGSVLFTEVLSSRLPLLATSDLHHPRQLRSWKTEFRCERNEAAILEAVRSQKVRFEFYEEAPQIELRPYFALSS